MKEFESRIGYCFNNKEILQQALTHTSYGYERGVPHNERLEFLGDAILGFVIAEWLYTNHPDVDEGVLSKQKSALVSEETLAKKARELDLGPMLFLGKGEMRSGGYDKPSILSDAVEAIIAAIEKDSGFKEAQRCIWELFEEELDQELLILKNDQDFKSVLQEKTQKLGLGFPEYLVKNIKGPEHKRIFHFQIVIGDMPGPTGEGSSKKRAQQDCAKKALADEGFWEKIKQIAPTRDELD